MGGLWALRTLFPLVSGVAPDLACSMAIRIFSRPGRPRPETWQRELLGSMTRGCTTVTRKRVATYVWGRSERRILLCHGWGARASHMGAFVQSLIESGFQVVAFDAPAHGDSDGTYTDIVEYSAAIVALTGSFGAFSGIVGHSFGAASAVFALHRHGLRVPRIVMLACFSDADWVFETFGKTVNLPPRVVRKMQSVSERRFGVGSPWSAVRIGPLSRDVTDQALLVHDLRDREIPHEHALAIAAARGGAATVVRSTDGLGHRRILRDESVVATVCQFFHGSDRPQATM